MRACSKPAAVKLYKKTNQEVMTKTQTMLAVSDKPETCCKCYLTEKTLDSIILVKYLHHALCIIYMYQRSHNDLTLCRHNNPLHSNSNLVKNLNSKFQKGKK